MPVLEYEKRCLMNLADHWNSIYSSVQAHRLGWYEGVPEPSLRLLDQCRLRSEDPILDVGAGASTLIDCLIDKGFRNLYAVDISDVALDQLKSRLGKEKACRVTWIVEDITHPIRLGQAQEIACWHDRALLHFLTEKEQRQAYKDALLKTLRTGGFAILAAFSPQGAKQCSGLNVHRYDQNSLVAFLGKSFELKDWFDYLYTMPSGDLRPYTYALFQKQSQ
jgi:SAM-dependent methyltransferase